MLGSVKSQIGHTKCAAGMAGLIKAALSIYHGVLPPTLNIKQPNPAWSRETSPFVFLDKARPWVADERIAAVSAFGFGGTNFHAVLAEHRGATTRGTDRWSSELFVFRGERAAVLAMIDRVEHALVGAPRLRDLARTVCAGKGDVQVAFVADSLDDVRGKLAAAREFRTDPKAGVFAPMPAVDGAVAFLCSGQGSQEAGHARRAVRCVPAARALPRARRSAELAAGMFPPAAFGADAAAAQMSALTYTRVAQPALGVAALAVADLLASCGVRPAMIAGHSSGELAALCIAGAIGERDLLPLSAARGEAILAAAGADPGTMSAVAADGETVARAVAGCDVVIANHNSPKQSVISGSTWRRSPMRSRG